MATIVTSDPFAGDFGQAVAYSPDLGVWVATGQNPCVAAVSGDGENWGSLNDTHIYNGWSVCWSPSLGLFAAVGEKSSAPDNQRVSTSPDGLTWTGRGQAAFTGSGYPVGCCWSEDLGLFVAVGIRGTGNKSISTSTDGIAWTGRYGVAGDNWTGVCWSPDAALFVAVGQNGVSGDQVITSPDGITWTLRGQPFGVTATGGWSGHDVTWAPTAAVFVAVGEGDEVADPTGSSVITSPDGITWTGQGNPFSGGGFNVGLGVAAGFCDTTETVLAVGWNGLGGVLLSSVDGGTTWTAEAGTFDGEGDKISYGPTSNFVAVGATNVTAFRYNCITVVTQYQRIYGWTVNISDDALETVDPVLTSPQGF